MKVKVVNNSSRKTRKLIRATFAEMLSEKGTIDKITVTELVKRANINRGTFYTHYDDVYAVAEDFETEILEQFDAASADIADIDAFVESFFAFIKENEPYYYYAYYRRSCCVHSSGRRICRCSPADRKAC